ncbi:MAG TPA: outer membrane beta-barrel protein [Bacteroidota bacterium]|nr:outer membrane beta-barrel protein [Bacteroidota bacterium]
MHRHTLALMLALFPAQAMAQTALVRGRVVEAMRKSPLAGVHVKLTNAGDTTETYLETTDRTGAFSFLNIRYQTCTLEATIVGYAPLTMTVIIGRPSMDLGDLVLSLRLIPLGEIVVQRNPPPTVQKADTTEFNARAFKTNPDAMTEELLAKMPGITVDNGGTITAQGEQVQQILIDGKPFFGSDPTLAIRNLPADAIEKIQVFDKMSDQAEFTGFDDGQAVKTINIVTRAEKRNQGFGKVTAGYGSDERYSAGGDLNMFRSGTRLSVIGLSNNVNQQNFSTQDLLGVVNSSGSSPGSLAGGGSFGRRGGGGAPGGFGGGGNGPGAINNFLVGQQSGIATTNSAGFNYNDTWEKNLEVNGSYFFNLTHAENTQRLDRQYFTAVDSGSLYDETTTSSTRNANNRVDMRLVYTADSSNSIIDLPRLYFQTNNAASLVGAASMFPTADVTNQADNDNAAHTSGYNLSNHLILRHKFDLPGRTISLDIGTGYNRKSGSSTLLSTVDYMQGTVTQSDTVDQQATLLTNSSLLSTRLVYTEPMAVNSLVQLSYSPSWTHNSSDNRKYAVDTATGQYSTLEENLSNSYDSWYTIQRAGIGFRYREKGLNVMTDVAYQIASLKGSQQFPVAGATGRLFYNIMPSITFNDVLSEHTNLRVFYRTATAPPGITQLQNVVDNTNPLLLTAGNPNLNQSYTHSFVVRYSDALPDKSRSFLAFLGVTYTGGYVGNSTVTTLHDTVLAGGTLVGKGTQLTVPVNLDGDWSLRSLLTYSLPFSLIESNLNLTSGFTFTRTPGLMQGELNIADSYALSAGAVVSSNISPEVDFTLSYNGSYTISRYSLQPLSNSSYYSQTAGVRINLIFLEGIVLRNDVNNVLYTGLAEGYNQDIVIWNAGLGKKFLTEGRGEVRLSATDILNQNRSVSRTISDSYIQDMQTQVLPRYILLSFTYTLR